MLSMVVSDDVRVPKGGEDRKFGVELFSLFLRHAHIVDFLATQNLAILLSAHLPDNPKGAMP